MFAYPNIKPDVFNPQEVYEVQLLLAYFLNQTEIDCTPEQLLEIATGEGIIDYFLYNEAIKLMLSSGTLLLKKTEHGEVYTLTERGREGAESFKGLVPKSVRDRILDSGLRLFARLKNERCNHVELTKAANGYNVVLEVADGDTALMKLSLFAPDMEQAELIKNKMQNQPSELYSEIMELALHGRSEY